MGHPADLRPSGEDWISRRFADLQRQIDELRAARSLPASSTKGGAFVFLDNNGNVRRAMGNVKLDGSIGGVTTAYGDFVYGDGGAILLAAREGDRGLIYPELALAAHDPFPGNAEKQVTSGTFTDLWEFATNFPSHEVLVVFGTVIIGSDGTTTGELRLRSQGGSTSTVLSVPNNSAINFAYEWLGPWTTGLYDPRAGRDTNLVVSVQARRTAGTGVVFVRQPAAFLSSRFVRPNADTSGHLIT